MLAMKSASCPTETVEAPVEMVWTLLTDPASWDKFYDIRTQRIFPEGPAIPLQIVYAESGPVFLHLKVELQFVEVDATTYRLKLLVSLPFGISVQEDLNCVSLGENQCRVNYHCNFSFPGGLRGAIVRVLLFGELKSGPVDSLVRLKNEAESRFLQSKNGSYLPGNRTAQIRK